LKKLTLSQPHKATQYKVSQIAENVAFFSNSFAAQLLVGSERQSCSFVGGPKTRFENVSLKNISMARINNIFCTAFCKT